MFFSFASEKLCTPTGKFFSTLACDNNRNDQMDKKNNDFFILSDKFCKPRGKFFSSSLACDNKRTLLNGQKEE